MREPKISLCLDDDGSVYQPGNTLSGEYRLKSVQPEEIRAIEVSVLWYTEGKGDEDMAVHEFWRYGAEDPAGIDLAEPGRFSTVLPYSPLSYDGMIVKVRWCVRVRAFVGRQEIVGQIHFQLGDVPPAQDTSS